ncbi:MAG: undecaprenyldiphospho-muramoylpentapeptide beta-N-acetylglucosaminyltransferase [Clostridia bacterium]|nr:undecaprenyldiphospho-muramoylpentapeptide beta-N-acetylglucosaminyltransferase [Clostridia bacterium]
MNVMITCGGTGGHIMPAIAIADMIKENLPHTKILFVGSEKGMEKELVPRSGYPIKQLRVEGISRSCSFQNLHAAWLTIRAIGHAKRIAEEFHPNLVIGTGGYACYPSLMAAARLGIPTAVHESNAIPGLAVKNLASHVDRVWLNFPSAAQGLSPKAKIAIVGNPLPRGYRIVDRKRNTNTKEKRVLSFGGSLGARELNRAVLSLMERELNMPHISHLHATGEREYEGFMKEFLGKGLDDCKRFRVVPFIHDMTEQMAAADLVICRAGAMSISELANLGCAAILVPSPNVTGNHQFKNAEALERVGAAKLLPEALLCAGALPGMVLSLLKNKEELEGLQRNILRFSHPDANRLIFEDITKLIKI